MGFEAGALLLGTRLVVFADFTEGSFLIGPREGILSGPFGGATVGKGVVRGFQLFRFVFLSLWRGHLSIFYMILKVFFYMIKSKLLQILYKN